MAQSYVIFYFLSYGPYKHTSEGPHGSFKNGHRNSKIESDTVLLDPFRSITCRKPGGLIDMNYHLSLIG